MTISTKPDDIDNPEVLLYYMESHPHSGENRAAAKLLRKLLADAPLVAKNEMTLACQIWHKGLPLGPMPVLYTDIINGEQVRRDDVWLATSDQLASAAPLVAATDIKTWNERMNDDQYQTHGDPQIQCMFGEIKDLRAALAGQVVLQATVEPLTDVVIRHDKITFLALNLPQLARNAEACMTGFGSDYVESLASDALALLYEYDGVLRGLASYLAAGGFNSEGLILPEVADAKIRYGIEHATPPTSKATEPFAGLQAHVARQERENAIDPAYGAWLDERAKQGIEAHGGNEVWDAAIRHSLATSKADTGEAIRNAALEEARQAFNTVIERARGSMGDGASLMSDANTEKTVVGIYLDGVSDAFEGRLLALKSAARSPIKAEPIGEQS